MKPITTTLIIVAAIIILVIGINSSLEQTEPELTLSESGTIEIKETDQAKGETILEYSYTILPNQNLSCTNISSTIKIRPETPKFAYPCEKDGEE